MLDFDPISIPIQSLTGSIYYLTYSSKVNGPSAQPNYGQSFGKTSLFLSMDQKSWMVVQGTRSYIEAKNYILKHHDLEIMQHLLDLGDITELAEDLNKELK